MRQVGAAVIGLLGQFLDEGRELLHRRVGQAIADADRLRLDAAPPVAARHRRQQGVDLVDDLPERRAVGRARMRQAHRQLRTDTAGVAAENEDTVGHVDRLLNVMGHDQDALGRDPPLDPQIEKIVAQGLGRQHVELRERFVEQQDVGVDDERARKADALLHAARQLFRIGALKPVETDDVDRLDGAAAAFGRRDALRLEAQFDIAEHGQPGKQRKALEHHRDAAHRPSDRLAAVFDMPQAWRQQPGEDAQKGRFSGARFAEHRDDLTLMQGEVDILENQPADMVGGAVGLADGDRAQRRGCRRRTRRNALGNKAHQLSRVSGARRPARRAGARGAG